MMKEIADRIALGSFFQSVYRLTSLIPAKSQKWLMLLGILKACTQRLRQSFQLR